MYNIFTQEQTHKPFTLYLIPPCLDLLALLVLDIPPVSKDLRATTETNCARTFDLQHIAYLPTAEIILGYQVS